MGTKEEGLTLNPKNESFEEQVQSASLEEITPKTEKEHKRGPQKGILVSGHDDVLVNIGRCCSPLPGEEIIGFIYLGTRAGRAKPLPERPVEEFLAQW